MENILGTSASRGMWAKSHDVYTQEIPEGMQATVNSINRELRKSGAANKPRTTRKSRRPR